MEIGFFSTTVVIKSASKEGGRVKEGGWESMGWVLDGLVYDWIHVTLKLSTKLHITVQVEVNVICKCKLQRRCEYKINKKVKL